VDVTLNLPLESGEGAHHLIDPSSSKGFPFFSFRSGSSLLASDALVLFPTASLTTARIVFFSVKAEPLLFLCISFPLPLFFDVVRSPQLFCFFCYCAFCAASGRRLLPFTLCRHFFLGCLHCSRRYSLSLFAFLLCAT